MLYGEVMPRLLFLAHRIPYPPDKGEKIRAWHMLDHLAKAWEFELGCLVDDPRDLDHIPTLRGRFAHVEAHQLRGRWQAALRALARLRPGLPLSLGWFHHPALAAWVRRGLAERCGRLVLGRDVALAEWLAALRR